MKPLNLTVIGLALGLFGAITFTLCILWDLALPGLSMTRLWEVLLPGFRGLSPGSYVLGLVESFLYGVYAAVVFVPLYNLLARRLEEPRAGGGMSHV